jgi:hypothetical protein
VLEPNLMEINLSELSLTCEIAAAASMMFRVVVWGKKPGYE